MARQSLQNRPDVRDENEPRDWRERNRTSRLGTIPQDADTTTFGRASSIRIASSWGANPPKTTECTAPIRAQASIATTASGIIGM